jgi:hypothetical protein
VVDKRLITGSIAAALCIATTLPALAQGPQGRAAWVDASEEAWVLEATRPVGLVIWGCDGNYSAQLAYVGRYSPQPQADPSVRNDPWTRQFAGVDRVTLRLLDRNRTMIAVIELKRNRDDGVERISKKRLTPAEARALKSAAIIEIHTGVWSGEFTGKGSTAAINNLYCVGD